MDRLLHERDASRDAGDNLARAVLVAIETGDTQSLAPVLYGYMQAEALIDRKFYLEMQAKERFLVAIFRFLQGPSPDVNDLVPR